MEMTQIVNNDLFSGVSRAVALSYSKGYAGSPGRGPEGKRCKDCKHMVRQEFAKTYFKCGLTNYTSGKATDIKATSPSCQYFEEAKE
jgi:hypothetical protein